MKLLANLFISAAAIFLVSYFVPGFKVDNFISAVFVALVLGVLNILIRPIILFLTLPLNLLTLGLFSFVINAFLLWLASVILSSFHIENFLVAIIAAVILWFINSAFQLAGKTAVE